ncbi:MFS transporter [Marinobacter halodurans]|uniref:MFS transporter n=1 Tax=Marinobacter halodurans TaxID=2528979 RepID=A0ABY1ZHX5_9GAMM|nr:MFS transporter [Marinobacter halodurans]TBW47532.1 MFS transporter [Marinobacter halodurans]
MSSLSAEIECVPGRLHQTATRITFLISGIALAAWAPLVPYAKARVDVGDGVFGLLLLCLGAGSILSMPLAGPMVSRAGYRRVIIPSALLGFAMLPLLASVSSLPWLIVALFLFGGGIGALDVAMNMQAIVVERASGRSLMSGFHGLFSLGAIIGAASMTGLLWLGVTPLMAASCVVGIVLIGLFLAAPGLLSDTGQQGGPVFAVPHGIVLVIGLVCFVSFLSEGAMLDWTAIFFVDHLDVDVSRAGLGFAAFSVTMTLGRLTGDRFVARFGGGRVVAAGGLVAACGIVLLTFAPNWLFGLLGCALVGAGCSNIVPVMFTRAGQQTAMPEHLAVPAVATLGYIGVLMGPATIGFLSELMGLGMAFLALAGLLLAVSGASRFLQG